MRKVVAVTGVWLRERFFDVGTEFTVTIDPKGERDVDPTTADAWSRRGWARDVAATKAAP